MKNDVSFVDTRQDGRGILGSTGAGRRLRWVGVAAWLGLWAALSGSGMVNSLLLPSPWRVLQAVGDIGPDLLLHCGATIGRVAVSFSLGLLLGVTSAILMQYSRTAYGLLDGLVETFRPVPIVALVPFFILLFGFAEIGKILVATLGVGLVAVVTGVEAIERVPIGVVRWGVVCGLSRNALFRLVILPAAWPEMRAGFRVALASAVTLVVVAEFMGAQYGLGYLISVSKVTLSTHTLLLSAMLLGWIGWALDWNVRRLFDRTCFWDVRARGATR